MEGYKDKTNDLLEAMKEQGYKLFFDGDEEDAVNTVEGALSAFPDYANNVIGMERTMQILRFRCDGQEYRDRVANLDMNRHNKHEKAIASLNMLNRICNAYGMEAFADVDTSDRYAVADFVGAYCCEVYGDGTGHTMDDAVRGRTTLYPAR